MTIRDLEPERDAEAMAALIRDVNPSAGITAASWLHGQLTTPERARDRTWVAEVDGVVAGRSLAFRTFFGGNSAKIFVAVGTPFRGRGIGTALYELAVEHALSLSSDLVTDFYETPEGIHFAEARGFRESRAEQLAVLDPRTVTERPTVEVRPLTVADLHDAHRIDDIATRDVPSHVQHEEISYAEWAEWVRGEPLFAREGSFLAYVDGGAAASSMLTADPESGRATTG